MRLSLALIWSTSVLCTGCTHLALERHTVKQASTLTDLQYQQVLDNVAMFCCNKDALPWHLKLRDGLVQVTDQGQATLLGVAGGTGSLANTISPSTNALRGILGQWGLVPAVDADELRLLRLAYLKAVKPLDPDLIKEIDDAICRLSIRFDILPNENSLRRLFAAGNVEGKIAENLALICDLLKKENKAESLKSTVRLMYQKIPKTLQIQECLDKIENPSDYFKSVEDDLQRKKNDFIRMWYRVDNILNPQTRGAPKVMSLSYHLFSGQIAPVQITNVLPPGINALPPTSQPLLTEEAALLLFALQLACAPGYIPPTWTHEPSGRNVGLIAQAGAKIAKLQNLIEEPIFQEPWFHCGLKKDVPKCACYVGHYCRCGQECYVWVMPEQMAALKAFTLAVLTLAPIEHQDISSLVDSGRGAAYSPSYGR